jgi:hypothetical protein
MWRYVEKDPMRFTLVLFTFLSFPSFACIPCAEDSAAIVAKQAVPVFPSSYKSEVSSGMVTFSLDLHPIGEIENIEIIEVYPNDLPKEALYKMIKNSQFKLTSPKSTKIMLPCSLKGNQFTFELNLPKKIKFEIPEIDL